MWWFLPCALAWSPASTEATRLPARPLAMAWLDPGSPTLLVLDGERLLALEGKDIVASRKLEAFDMLVADLDGDDRPEVLVCGTAGLAAVPVGSRSLGEPIPLDPTPCRRLVARSRAEGQLEVVLTGPQGTRAVGVSDEGLKVRAVDMSAEGEPLLAATTTSILLGSRGSNTLQQSRGGQVATVPLGGPLLDLAVHEDHPVWLRGGEPSPALFEAGEVRFLQTPVERLAVLPWPEGSALVAWSDDAWVGLDASLPTGLPIVGDPNGDDCPDLTIAVETGFVQVTGNCDGTAAVMAPTEPRISDEGATPVDDTEDAPEASRELIAEDVHVDEDVDEDDTWPPSAWTSGERVRPRDLPSPPGELALSADTRPLVRVFAGQTLRMNLSPPTGRIEQVDGGPPGTHLEDGAFVLDTAAWDIGRWGVSTRGRPGEWYGFDLEVWPRPRVGDPVPDAITTTVASEASPPPKPAGDRWYHIDRCAGGIGVAGGASQSGGLAWEDLGNPDVVASGSPAFAVMCTGGGVVSWALGLDAAPWFRYADLPVDRSHLIGATASVQVGTERFGVGPYGSAGVTAVNVGLRGQGFVSDRFGAELRAGWLAPRAGVEAMALFLVRLGP